MRGTLLAGAVLLLGSGFQNAVTEAAVPVPKTASAHDFALIGALTQGGWIKGVAPAGTQVLTLDGMPLTMAPDGGFFAAFDRDAAASAELVARRGDASVLRRLLKISPRVWPTEYVNAPFRSPALPDAEFARIRSGELAQIGAARALASDAAGWRQDFIWPITGRISGRFGRKRFYQGQPGSYHPGMDIAAGQGSAFIAPADGVVILATSAPFTLEGMLLMIDHGGGLSSAFLHCSRLAVRTGDRVRQGQVIGYVGMSGRATGPHLHWGLRWREARLDPLLFVPPQG